METRPPLLQPATRAGGESASKVITYRYVRVALFVLIAGLVTVVLSEVVQTGCARTSLSAYFYTPAGRVFSAVLVAIGALLICLKAEHPFEDFMMKVAGMAAPIVGLVPTTKGAA